MKMLEQLQIAMNKQPTLSVLQIINEALELKYSTRKYIFGFDEEFEKWKPTNHDIQLALMKYNEVRNVKYNP